MTLVFFAYPIAAVLGHPNWGEVARGAFVPRLHKDPDYIFLLVGLIGTTITPYMQIFQQSSIVERGSDRRRYGPERADAGESREPAWARNPRICSPGIEIISDSGSWANSPPQ